LGRKTPLDELQRVYDAVEAHGQTKAAELLSLPRTTLASQYKAAKSRLDKNEPSPPELPVFPDEDIPVEDIIDTMSRRFEKRSASYKAHTWFPVRFKSDEPVAILWVGDPHVDDNGCNWPVLKRHAELCQTAGVYAVNIGDVSNNWAGRLQKLYAEQDASVGTARKLAEWLMLDSGIHWLVWLIGNHDAWGDGAEILAQMAKRGTTKLVCHDWEARFRLCFPNGWEARVFAAHDFKGYSMWNPLHGPMKAGAMGPEADIYVCGHKHNWAVFNYENASRGREQHFIRVRGYKFLDDYARRLGIIEQEGGCSMLTVFDPSRESMTTFSDVERGVEFLNVLRNA
jgi:hypothetical protein